MCNIKFRFFVLLCYLRGIVIITGKVHGVTTRRAYGMLLPQNTPFLFCMWRCK